MGKVPLCVQLFQKLDIPQSSKNTIYKFSALVLTYISYTSYHMARKPLSVVKNSEEFVNCSQSVCSSWVDQLDGKPEDQTKTILGLLDTTYLVCYAFFTFLSGPVADRVDLRVFLTVGMVGSGLFTAMFGLAYRARVHSIWYFFCVQALTGLFHTTGWPGVLTVVANWFQKDRKGFIMGAWYSHASVGNILGAISAGIFADDNWGLSFIIPGLIMMVVGVLLFLFLVPDPAMVDIDPHSCLLSTTSSSEDSLITSDRKTTSSFLNTRKGESEPLLDQTKEVIGFWRALKIPGVVEYSLCLFFAKLVLYTFRYWLPNYINDTSNYDASSSANLSTFFDVGGIFGAVLVGLISDWTGYSASTCVSMFLLSLPSMILYQNLQSDWCPLSQVDGLPAFNSCYILNCILLFLTGVLVNGPYALIMTVVSSDLGTHHTLKGSKKAMATVSAIIEGTASIGAAVGPSLAGWLAGDGDWGKVFGMMMGADAAAAVLLGRVVIREIKNK